MPTEAKPFASLSSGLLARKGAARPAMRPQGFGQVGNGLEDLGWNDMGFEPPKPTEVARDSTHDAFGDDVVEHPRAHPTGLTPVGSPVHDQQAEIFERFNGSDEAENELEEVVEPAEQEPKEEVQVRTPAPMKQAVVAVAPEPMKQAVAAVAPEPMKQAVAAVAPAPMKQAVVAVAPEPMKQAVVAVAPEPMKQAVVAVAPEPMKQAVAAVAPEPMKQVLATVAPAPMKQAVTTVAPAPVKPAVAAVVPEPAPRRAPRARSAPGTKGRAAFTLRLDPERHLKLRLACAVDGRSAQQFVTDALDQLLERMPELDGLAQKAKRGGKSNEPDAS